MFVRKITEPKPVFNDWRPDLWDVPHLENPGYTNISYKVKEKEKPWTNKCETSKEKLQDKDDNLENEDIMPYVGINGPQSSQVFNPHHGGYSALNLGKEKSSDLDLLFHNSSTVPDALGIKKTNDKAYFKKLNPEALNYGSKRMYKYPETNEIPAFYKDSDQSDSATDSQAEQSTQIHYLNEHIPSKVRDSRSSVFLNNPSALFAPYYPSVPEYHPQHLKEGPQNIKNSSSSLSPLKTVAQEELAKSLPEISTDGLDKLRKLVEQQRKDREFRINSLGLHLNPSSRNYHHVEDPVEPNFSAKSQTSRTAPEKHSKIRLVASAPPVSRYKGFSIPSTHSSEPNEKTSKLRKTCHTAKDGDVSQKKKETKATSKVKKLRTRISATRDKPPKDNASGIITTWAWRHCQEAALRELGDFKMISSSSHSPPTHDTDYQQTVNVPAKEDTAAIDDLKAMLDSSKKILSEEARTILNDLQLTKSGSEDTLKSRKDGSKERSETHSKLVTEAEPINISITNFNRSINKKPLKISSKRKATKATDAENLPVAKHRHYNSEDVRKYIAQQQADRKRRQLQEHEATKLALEQRNKRLQELYLKQKETVLNNKYVKTHHKKEPLPKSPLTLFSTDSNNKLTAAQQVSSELMDEENIEDILIKNESISDTSEIDEDDDTNNSLSNEDLPDPAKNRNWTAPNHPFVTVRSTVTRNSLLKHNHTPSPFKTTYSSLSPPVYHDSPGYNVTSNNYYHSPHSVEFTTHHSLPAVTSDDYLVEPSNEFVRTTSRESRSSAPFLGSYTNPVPSGAFNDYLRMNLRSKDRIERIKAIKEVADSLQGRIAAQTQQLNQEVNPATGSKSFQNSNIQMSDLFDEEDFPMTRYDRITQQDKDYHVFDDKVPGVRNLSEHIKVLEKDESHHKAATRIQAAYRGYHTRRPNDKYKIKSRKKDLTTPDSEENSHNSVNHTSLSTGTLATDDSDLAAYSKRLARNVALTTECWKLKSDLHSPSDSRNYNLPLPVPEPDQHSVINIFMQRLKEDKDKLQHTNKSVPTATSFGHPSSLQTDSRSSSPVDDQATPNSSTSISKTSSPSLSPTSFQRPKRPSTNLDTSSSSVNKRFSYDQSSFKENHSTPPLPTSQKAKSSTPTIINKRDDNGIDKELSLSWKTTQDSIPKIASPDNTLNMSSSLTDEETSNVIKSQSIDRNTSEHSKIEAVPLSPEHLESRTQLDINQYSPTTLHLKLAAELARLETVEESLKQLDHIERARAIALAQQETVSLAHILKARQQNHKQEIENLSVQMKQESSNNLEEIRRMAAETVQTTAENVVKLSQETTATIQDSAHKLIQAQTETAKVAAEAAKQLAEAHTASLIHLSTGSTHHTNKIAAEAASTAVSVAIATALDEQRKQQVEFFRHFRKDTISTPPKDSSPKSEGGVSLPISIGLEEIRGSKSSAAILSKKKSDSRESSPSIVTAYDSSKLNKSFEQGPANKCQSRSEIIPEEDENSSVRLDEFTEEEGEIDEQSHQVSPSENHRRSSKKEKSHTESITSESNLTVSDRWKLTDQNLFPGEDSFKKYTSEMIKQYMEDEEVRAKHHAALLRLRERALKEKTKAEMAWLELQKKRLKDKGADDLMPPLRKKQRGLLLRFQEERAEIKRLKEAQKLASQKRQLLLYQQQEITRIQQSTQQILEKIKKSGLCLSQQSVSTEDEVSMPIYDGSQSDIQDEASAALPNDNSMTDNASETPSISQDIPPSPSDTESKVMKKLKKLESQSSARYLTKREQKLRQRREHIEALLAWGENLDKEEAEISNMEKKALELLGKQEKAVQALESSSPKDKVEIDESKSIVQDIEEESYLNDEELKATFNRSETEEELPCEKRRKSTNSDNSISEDSPRLKYSTSEEENIEAKQESRKTQIFFGSDNIKTSYSISTHEVSESSPPGTQQLETSPPLYKSSIINTKSDSIKEVNSPSKSLASSWHSKSDDSSSIDSISPPKNSPSLQSKISKEITEDIHTSKGPGSNSRDPSISLKAPLSPRPAQKRRDSSCSDDSISVSHSETASDQSDMEGRIRALKEELKRRKIEVARLKREQKRRNHERLRAQEASLLIQIEAYDKFIIQAKDELNKELELDVKAPGLKPQIKQPRRLQRQESTEAILLRTANNLRSDEIRDNDDVFKAISPGWMSDQLSVLKRVSLESIDESNESSESPIGTPTLRDLPVSEIASEIDEEVIKDEIAGSVTAEQSDGSDSVKSDSTVKNQFISLNGSVNVEDSSLQIEVNKFVAEEKENKIPEVEIEKDSSEISLSKIETVKESTILEEIEHDNTMLDVFSNISTRNEPTTHDVQAASKLVEASYSEDFSDTSSAIDGRRSRSNSELSNKYLGINIFEGERSRSNSELSNKSFGINVFEGERSRSNSELSNKSLTVNEKDDFISKNEKSENISYLKSPYVTNEISEHSSNSSHTISHLEELKKPQIGDRVNIEGSMMGILRFIGKTLFAKGFWAGVELEHADGNCDGAIDGVGYFHCDFNYGLFVPLNKISLSAIRTHDEKEIEEELPSKDSGDTLVEEESPQFLFREIEQLQERGESLEMEQNSDIDRSLNESILLNQITNGNVEKEIMTFTFEDKIQDSDADLQDVICSTALAVEQFSSSPLPWLLAEEKKADGNNESTKIEEKRRLALNGLVDKITDSLANMIIQDSVSVISSIAKQQNIVKKGAEKQNSATENLINTEIVDSTAYEIHIEEEMIIEISEEFSELSKQTLATEISQTLTLNLLNDAITYMMNISKRRITSGNLLESIIHSKESNAPETTLDKVHSLLARHNEKKKEQNWSKTIDIFALSPQDAYSDALESPEFPSPVHVPSEKRATSPTSEVDEIMKGRQGGDSREGSTSPTSPVPRPSSPVFGEPAPLNQAELQEKLATLHFLDMDIMEGSVFGEQSLFGDQEWFDDDFGLGHQKDSHNRQIPPKPAPPYSPPAQWNLSRLELKKITAKVFCAVPHNEKDVQELVNKAVKEFYNRRKYGEPLVDVPPPVNYFTRDDRNEDIESRSRRTYKHFLFELTGYLVQEIYGDDEAPERPIWMKPARNQHHKFCKRCPTNEQELQEIVLNSINQLLGFLPMAKQEWPYVKWSRKKKDRVDEILVQELREEEQSWVIYDDDELSVKMQLTDAILDSLILDTVRTFSVIFAKKKAKLNSNYDY